MKKFYGSEKVTFLSFSLGKERFAVEVSNVLEVLRNQIITPVPKTSEYIEGIINFRGDILTVVNTRKKLKMTTETRTATNIVMVLEFKIGNDFVILGALVDKVKNVFEINEKEIKAVPEFGSYYNPEFLQGAIKDKDGYLVLLDIPKIFSAEDVEIIKNASK